MVLSSWFGLPSLSYKPLRCVASAWSLEQFTVLRSWPLSFVLGIRKPGFHGCQFHGGDTFACSCEPGCDHLEYHLRPCFCPWVRRRTALSQMPVDRTGRWQQTRIFQPTSIVGHRIAPRFPVRAPKYYDLKQSIVKIINSQICFKSYLLTNEK